MTAAPAAPIFPPRTAATQHGASTESSSQLGLASGQRLKGEVPAGRLAEPPDEVPVAWRLEGLSE